MRGSQLAAVLASILGLLMTPTGTAAKEHESEATATEQRYVVMFEAARGVPHDVAEMLARAGGRPLTYLAHVIGVIDSPCAGLIYRNRPPAALSSIGTPRMSES